MRDRGRTRLSTPLPARLRAVLAEVPALVAVFRGPDLVVEFTNLTERRLKGAADVTGRPLRELLAAAAADPGSERYVGQLERTLRSGVALEGWEAAARLPGSPADRYWDYVMIPLRDDPSNPPTGVVLHATEVTRLVEARRRAAEAEHRFTTLFDSNVIGVTISDEQQVHEANDAFLQIVGRTRAELADGLRWTDITAPGSLPADEHALAMIRRAGAAPPYDKEYVRPDGSTVPVLISGSRLQSDPLRVLATAYDLTERRAVEREVAALLERERAARRAAEVASARASRLADISASLSASNSPDEVARAVVHRALEDLSASAGLFVRGHQDPRLTHAAGFPPEQVQEWQDFPATLPRPVLDAVRHASPVTLPTADAVAEQCPGLRPSGAVVAVPLEVLGRVLGAVGLVFREGRVPTPEDWEFLLSLASQAAAALDRAQLYENRAYVARTLQQGLLPQRLADAPGLETAVVYESISGSGEVGGDFYDFFETGPARWVLTIGDVTGKGTEAAVVTGLTRHTLRAVARMDDDPARMLEFLNGALLRHSGAPAFCTVGCAVIEPVEGVPGRGFAVRVSSGGQPFPILVRADGGVEPVEVTGTMLGVCEDPVLDVVTVRLAAGDAVVAYTDGVLDARRPGGERFGEGRLLDALRRAAGGTAADLAGGVEAAVRGHLPGSSADDRAIVVVRALA